MIRRVDGEPKQGRAAHLEVEKMEAGSENGEHLETNFRRLPVAWFTSPSDEQLNFVQ